LHARDSRFGGRVHFVDFMAAEGGAEGTGETEVYLRDQWWERQWGGRRILLWYSARIAKLFGRCGLLTASWYVSSELWKLV